MANPVTDPELLAALNGPEPKGKVTDPALLATLEGTAHPLVAAHTEMSTSTHGQHHARLELAPASEMSYG